MESSSTMMSAFLADENVITDKDAICEMWGTNFVCLWTPSGNFKSNFLSRVNDSVKDIVTACTLILNSWKPNEANLGGRNI